MRETLKRVPVIARANEFLKARIQEWQAEQGLRHYERQAERRGLVPHQGNELQRALRARVAGRRRARAASRMGELHVFLAYYVENWEAVLPAALAPFGRVSAFNWREHGFDDTARDWLQHRDAMNRAMLAAFRRAQEAHPVDAVVGYLSGYNTAPATLAAMARAGAVIFNFCWDDKLMFPGARVGGRYHTTAALAPVVDLNLTNAPSSIVKYAVHGGLALFWPEAAHPAIHRPHATPFEFDVGFVGSCYGWRPRFIRRLARAGIAVRCHGPGWPAGQLDDREMVRFYSRCRINLGFSGIGHSRSLMCLKGRDFEVPMSGGLYLTQDNPELALVYDVGRDIVTYRDEADCARTIHALLADPGRAAAIRAAGRARCLRDHTYEARWSRVFRLAGLLQSTLDADGR